MFRKDLIEMLHGNPMTVNQIARLVDESPGRIATDLNHLLRSLKHTEYNVESATADGACEINQMLTNLSM